jgi:hypothetical protein
MDGDRATMAEDESKMDRDKAKMAQQEDSGGCLERFGRFWPLRGQKCQWAGGGGEVLGTF